MKRLRLLLAVPLLSVVLSGCASEGTPARETVAAALPPSLPLADAPAPHAPASPSAANDVEAREDVADPSEETSEAPRFPLLSVQGGKVASPFAYVVTGKVENTNVPTTFALSKENDCARDVKLRTMNTGIGYAVTLGPQELAESFGCALQAWAGDELLGPVTVTPEAEWTSGALRLSGSPSVAAADQDRTTGDVVRFTVVAADAIGDARVVIAGTTFLGTLAPYAEGDDDAPADDRPTSAIFEIPAAAWAGAVLMGNHAMVDVKLTSGRHHALDVRPTAKAEALVSDDCEG